MIKPFLIRDTAHHADDEMIGMYLRPSGFESLQFPDQFFFFLPFHGPYFGWACVRRERHVRVGPVEYGIDLSFRLKPPQHTVKARRGAALAFGQHGVFEVPLTDADLLISGKEPFQ